MEITREQRNAWSENPENAEWEPVIGPFYKRPGLVADVEALFAIAELNGLGNLRPGYSHLNAGQIVMALRNRLRPRWRAGLLKLPTSTR